MKKIILLIVVVSLGLSSCKKDKIKEDDVDSLIGKWYVETDNSSSQQLGYEVQNHSESYQKGEFYLEFRNTGKVYIKTETEIANYDYIFNKATHTVDINFSTGVQTYQISELTSSRLVLYNIHTVTNGNEVITITQQLICAKE